MFLLQCAIEVTLLNLYGKSTINQPFHVLSMTCCEQVEVLFSLRLALCKATYDERCRKFLSQYH